VPAIGGGRVVAAENLLANPAGRHIIRDGKTLPCSEVYIPTAEELGMKDSAINDIQKGRKKGG